MARRRSNYGTGYLIFALLFVLLFFLSPFFVVFGGLVEADATLWALVLVFYIVAGIWFSYGYKQLGEEEQRLLPLLFFFVVLPFFVVLGWLKEADATLWASILVLYIVRFSYGYKQKRLHEREEQRRREEEAKRLLAQELAEEERQRCLREQEEQRRREEEEERISALELSDVDNMSPGEFEQYVGELMKRRGYKTKVIGKAGDMGVDVVAQNGAKKYAVQVKRYNQPVSRLAVSDAVAGKEHYGCNAAMVVTNNYFTKGAMDLARSTKCQLIDRDTLADWIVDSRKETTKERKNKGSYTGVESKNHSTPVDLILRDLIAQRKQTNAQNHRPSIAHTSPAHASQRAPRKLSHADEDGRGQSQEGKTHVKSERITPAPSPTLTPPAMSASVEELNQHPLNQKALELLEQIGAPADMGSLHVLTFLYTMAEREYRPAELNPEWDLEMLLEPLDSDQETMNILLGKMEGEEGEIYNHGISRRSAAQWRCWNSSTRH